ncbi:MAG: ribonuclease III [Candidatus Korobacteraceae bacterium]|jgi:ribonuclease-3
MKFDPNDLSMLEAALGHPFRRRDLLEQALTHASFAREVESKSAAAGAAVHAPDNEQMEFLGDAVLSFVVSQELFRRFPEYQEGELSKLRAHIVSARHLLRPARALEIGEFLRLGKGEERSGGRNKSALLTDALEAIIAALYLDGGLEPAHRFILQMILDPELAEVHKAGDTHLPVMDYKSALQEATHASGRPQPRYVVVKEEGPDHRKLFTVEAHVSASAGGDKGFVRRSEGSTKKLAEQGAARKAWDYLQLLKAGSVADAPSPASELK